MAVGALGALPAASTADAAYTALTAHAIPVTCCRGQEQRGQSPSGPCQQLTGSLPKPDTTPVPSAALQEDVPGLSGLRPPRGSWP